jgi:hypothetical protein
MAYSVDMQQVYAAWTRSRDKQQGHVPTCRKDMQQGHEASTYSIYTNIHTFFHIYMYT